MGFRATDYAGNVETAKTTTVRIDTRRPTTVAPYRASVRRYRYVTLRYSVKDPKPTCGKATVTIRITTLGGRTVKTLRAGTQVGQHQPGLPLPLRACAAHVPLRGLRQRPRGERATVQGREPAQGVLRDLAARTERRAGCLEAARPPLTRHRPRPVTD